MNKPVKVSKAKLLASAGKGLGLMAVLSPSVGALYEEVKAAGTTVDHLSPKEAAQNERYWKDVSNAFSISRGDLNLNSGWTSPSPKMVEGAYVRYKRQEAMSAATVWERLTPQVEIIREGLAGHFGCETDEIAITRNASESLQILLFGLDIRHDDEVVTTSQDYPRMLTALRQRELREGPRLKLVKIPLAPASTDEIVAAIESAISPRTRLILVSHMINITGQIMPVRKIVELGRSRGIETVVDGAHSFAQLDFKRDDLQCDYFGSSLHKWLYTPKGVGLLYVKKEKINGVWPLMASDEKLRSDIRKFEEIGTHSLATKLAIGEALLFHDAVGPKRKEERLRYLTSYWMERLSALPGISFNTSQDPKQYCGIANFAIDGGEVTKITDHLMKRHRIIATPTIHSEFTGIRITPNIFTSISELDRFCGVIEHLTRKGLPKDLRL